MGEFYLILLFDFVVLDEYANVKEILGRIFVLVLER